MALGRLNNRSRNFSPPKLMLTSMMDMFTIILIFLLFSFSENPETMAMDKELDLPTSSAELEYQQAAKIVLSRKELLLNDEVMAVVAGNQIVGLDPDALEQSILYQRLKSYRSEQQAAVQSTNNDPNQIRHVLFLCDKSFSFKVINSVIKTAGMAGYPNFQFAVLEAK